MDSATPGEIVNYILSQGKRSVNVDVDLDVDKKQFLNVLQNLLGYEYLLDIKLNKLPMCYFVNGFDHMDNSHDKAKIKNRDCFKCRLNYFCNGYFPEMAGFVESIPSAPEEVVIEATDRCNLKCDFCFNCIEYSTDFRNSRKELSANAIKGIIDQTAGLGSRYLKFSGGEPLLRKDLRELIKYAKKKGLEIGLNTNGTLITKSWCEFLLKNVDNILIPLAGPDSKSDSRVTGMAGSFEKKVEAIKKLRSRVGVVLLPRNVARLEEFYRLKQDLNVDYLEFYRLIAPPDTDTSRALRLAIEGIFKLNLKYGVNAKIQNAIPFCCHKLTRRVAVGGMFDDGATRMVVDSGGNIKPSYYWTESFGDELFSAWNSRAWMQLRELQELPKECKKCVYVHTCRGGSRSIAKIMRSKKDPLMTKPIQ